MIFVNAILCLFYCSLLFQRGYSVSSTSEQVTSHKTFDISTSSKCHNVHFNNYYSEPANKDIKTHLLKIENQLADVQKKIHALTDDSSGELLILGKMFVINFAELSCLISISVKVGRASPVLPLAYRPAPWQKFLSLPNISLL